MSAPLVVTIPHRLGREEAVRRLKNGLGQARTSFSHQLTVDEEVWAGDRLTFRIRALGQSSSGIIDVNEDNLRLEVTLPWLLAKLSERFVPAIRREGTLLLEKK
jgi:Putative polyhydroxyalkanoic acid system protein (PHA_gran_rgn)